MTVHRNTAKKPTIGWIGLGKMGLPMSRNLARAGYPLIVYDIIKGKAAQFPGEAVQEADSLRQLAREADIIISIIPDDGALKAIALGPDGCLPEMKTHGIFVDMSTVSAGASLQVAQCAADRNIQYLRAPVSGSTVFAEQGKLTVMASGPAQSYRKCLDIFRPFAEKILYVGSGDEARFVKLLINMMVGNSAAMLAEALTFGKRGGLDWQQMLDVIASSVVGSRLLGFKIPPVKERDFTPAFTAAQMCKDFDIALDTGREVAAAMPLTALVRQYLGIMKARGTGDLDYFGLVTVWEDLANL